MALPFFRLHAFTKPTRAGRWAPSLLDALIDAAATLVIEICLISWVHLKGYSLPGAYSPFDGQEQLDLGDRLQRSQLKPTAHALRPEFVASCDQQDCTTILACFKRVL